jgi:hypothetical protein
LQHGEGELGISTRIGFAALVALVAAAAVVVSAAAPLMDWPDLLGRPLPRPSERVAYGPGSMQFGELWLPAGKGPFPVVLMIHGGCWRSNIAKLSIMNYAAHDLAARPRCLEHRISRDRPAGRRLSRHLRGRRRRR